jgi:hypothetical protein
MPSLGSEPTTEVVIESKDVGMEPDMLDDLSEFRPPGDALHDIQAKRRGQETNLAKSSLEIRESTPLCIFADKSKS